LDAARVASITGYDEQGQARFTVPSALTGQVAAVNIVLDEPHGS